MTLKTLRDIPDLKGKRVLVRVDFNVPLDAEGNVKNDKRMRFALPTLKHLLEKGASKLILITHVGRPKGVDPLLKTDKIAAHLQKMLGVAVAKAEGWGEKGLPETPVVLLENIRFHPAEKSKDEAERDAFGRKLASLADLYVDEAFSNCHRKHASMTSVPKFIPGFAGFGVEKEASELTAAIQNPERPLVALVGGLKAEKLNAIRYLLGVADVVLVAGAIAFSLIKAKGGQVGASKVDEEGMTEAGDLVQEILKNPKLHLPKDAVAADAFSATANAKIVAAAAIPEGWMALDIGPKTTAEYEAIIAPAKTVLWFGPIGVFEMEKFAGGTRALGKAVAAAQGRKIVGGGDSAAAVEALNLQNQMTLVSTGGGASLEVMEGKLLPGIEALKR